jgi:hypothetical protein
MYLHNSKENKTKFMKAPFMEFYLMSLPQKELSSDFTDRLFRPDCCFRVLIFESSYLGKDPYSM